MLVLMQSEFSLGSDRLDHDVLTELTAQQIKMSTGHKIVLNVQGIMEAKTWSIR